MQSYPRCAAVLTAVALMVLPTSCSASSASSDTATSTPAPSAAPSGDPPSTADSAASASSDDLVEWMTLACIAMSPGEPLELVSREAVTDENRALLAKIARQAVKLYGVRLDLLRELPEPPTSEAESYIKDFRKTVKSAKKAWRLVASTAESEDVSLENLRTFVGLAGVMTMAVDNPLPPETGPLRDAHTASWRCTGIR